MTNRGVFRLLAHVSSHLDEDLGLDALARQVRCSPFALHRQFKSTAGETPKAYAERLRLERAAARLVCGDGASILTVALDVGFQSHEVFTRAFRRRFGMSPAQYRARGLTDRAGAAVHAAVTHSVGPCVGLFRTEATPTTRRESMTYDVVRTQLPEQPVLFIRRKAKSSEIAKTLAEILPQVFVHAQRSGVALAGPPFCRYAAWGPLLTLEAGLPVASAASGNGEIEAGVLQGGPVAKATHTGAYDALADAHAAVETWADGQGLSRAGALWESYVTDPGQTPDPKEWKTDVFLPLQA